MHVKTTLPMRLEDFQINAHKCNSLGSYYSVPTQQWRQFLQNSNHSDAMWVNSTLLDITISGAQVVILLACTHVRIKMYREKMQLFFYVLFFNLRLMLLVSWSFFFCIETFKLVQLAQREKCSICSRTKEWLALLILWCHMSWMEQNIVSKDDIPRKTTSQIRHTHQMNEHALEVLALHSTVH
jgi:hypothetical protein